MQSIITYIAAYVLRRLLHIGLINITMVHFIMLVFFYFYNALQSWWVAAFVYANKIQSTFLQLSHLTDKRTLDSSSDAGGVAPT